MAVYNNIHTLHFNSPTHFNAQLDQESPLQKNASLTFTRQYTNIKAIFCIPIFTIDIQTSFSASHNNSFVSIFFEKVFFSNPWL